MEHEHEWPKECRVRRWVDDLIAKQTARLYHKADNPRGSNYAPTVAMEPSVVETREEHARDICFARFGLVEWVEQITNGHLVVSRIVETNCG